jgi:hypothetical protein
MFLPSDRTLLPTNILTNTMLNTTNRIRHTTATIHLHDALRDKHLYVSSLTGCMIPLALILQVQAEACSLGHGCAQHTTATWVH